jgi:hypothetical protein
MRYEEYHEAWEMKPRKLSTEEIDNPEKVIDEFFQIAHLPQVRAYLWDLMKTMVTGTFSNLKSRERTKLIYFYEQMEKLIEVAHVLHQRKRELPAS